MIMTTNWEAAACLNGVDGDVGAFPKLHCPFLILQLPSIMEPLLTWLLSFHSWTQLLGWLAWEGEDSSTDLGAFPYNFPGLVRWADFLPTQNYGVLLKCVLHLCIAIQVYCTCALHFIQGAQVHTMAPPPASPIGKNGSCSIYIGTVKPCSQGCNWGWWMDERSVLQNLITTDCKNQACSSTKSHSESCFSFMLECDQTLDSGNTC